MDKKIIKYLSDPVKSRIIFQILELGQATTKDLVKKNPEIPQASLYRYLKAMLADGVIKIAHERKVRNVTEKIYEMNYDINAAAEKMIEENDGAMYYAIVSQFVNEIMSQFEAYSKEEDIDILEDVSGFRQVPFWATKEEVVEMTQKISDVVQPYFEQTKTPGRRLRTFARIITPPVKEGKTNE